MNKKEWDDLTIKYLCGECSFKEKELLLDEQFRFINALLRMIRDYKRELEGKSDGNYKRSRY